MPPTNQLLIAFVSAVAIAVAAWRVKSLSRSGAVAAVFVGFALFGFAGWRGAVALLLFFVSSSLLSKIGKRRKEALAFEKGGERDAMQVLANGGFAAACAFFATPNNDAKGLWMMPMMLLLGALATANADTWATEIGTLFKHPPRRITNLAQRAETGESGAVSLPGTLASFAGACLIAILTWSIDFGPMHFRVGAFLAVALGGFGGSLFDSILGATAQAMYRRQTTSGLTERARENGRENELVRGDRHMTNDAVNFWATVVGAILSVALMLISWSY